MDAATRSALESTAKRYFEMVATANTTALQQNSVGGVAANFDGIAAAIKENQSALAGAEVTVRPPHLLVAEGTEALANAEFLCGVFGKFGQTADSTVFQFRNLPPGKYGVAIVDAKGPQQGRTVTLILQPAGSEWKVAGFYIRASQVNGHDGAWFAQKAREFKTKGQNRNAWLYFQEARALSSPADFMSTATTDKLYDEAQTVKPADLPEGGNAVELTVNGVARKLIAVFPLVVGSDLDLVVRYEAADVSDSAKTFQENSAVIRALLAKFPEFREAFINVVARAVEPSGRDFGSMMAMKDIK